MHLNPLLFGIAYFRCFSIVVTVFTAIPTHFVRYRCFVFSSLLFAHSIDIDGILIVRIFVSFTTDGYCGSPRPASPSNTVTQLNTNFPTHSPFQLESAHLSIARGFERFYSYSTRYIRDFHSHFPPRTQLEVRWIQSAKLLFCCAGISTVQTQTYHTHCTLFMKRPVTAFRWCWDTLTRTHNTHQRLFLLLLLTMISLVVARKYRKESAFQWDWWKICSREWRDVMLAHVAPIRLRVSWLLRAMVLCWFEFCSSSSDTV